MSISSHPSSNPFSSTGLSEADRHGAPLEPAEEQATWAILGGFSLLLVAAYWNMLARTAAYWSDDLYSHGYVVPIIAAYLFWMRRKRLTSIESPERWIGLGILAASLSVRLIASYFDMAPLDRLSFVGALIGLFQLVGGMGLLRWAGWPVVFLLFMFPLPSKLEITLLSGLQRLAAICSCWTLQTLGVPAVRDGSRIIIDELTLGVVDACSGLRMLSIFCALAVAMALMIDRPWWDRFIILLSAIPIALIANIIRITITALLFMQFGQENETLNHIIHDWAGFAMMPIGLGILWIEMQLLTRITVPIETDDYAHFGAAVG